MFNQYSIFRRILQGGGLFFDYGGAEIKLWGSLKRGGLMLETGARFTTGSAYCAYFQDLFHIIKLQNQISKPRFLMVTIFLKSRVPFQLKKLLSGLLPDEDSTSKNSHNRFFISREGSTVVPPKTLTSLFNLKLSV